MNSRGGTLGINRRNLDFVYASYAPGKFEGLDDKLLSKKTLEAVGVPTPRTLAVIETPPTTEDIASLLAAHPYIVFKPARGLMGKGILLLQSTPGGTTRIGGERMDPSRVADHVAELLTGVHSLGEEEHAVLVEERIREHPDLRRLHGDGLADIRIILHRGEPLQAMCRVPTRASGGKANLHGGGIGIGLTLEDGVSTGASCRGRVVARHPDTNVEFEGFRVPDWERCLELARRSAAAFDVEYIGIDIVLDSDRGPLVLEVNARPGLEIQVVNRTPLPVPPSKSTRFERTTFRATWILLGLLAISPLAMRLAQSLTMAEASTLSLVAFDAAADTDEPLDPRGGVEWEDRETPLSIRSDSFASALQAVAAGDTLRALDLYEKAAENPSVEPFALNNMALLLRARGETEKAAEAFERAVTAHPAYYRGRYNYGLLLLDRDEFARARTEFESALEARPSHAGSWAKLGFVLQHQGETAAAVEAYDQAIRYQPTTRRYRLEEARLLRDLGETARAARRFEELFQLGSKSEDTAYWWVRSALDASLDFDEAAATRALARHADESDRCLSLMADLEWRRRNLAAALRTLETLSDRGVRPAYHERAARIVALEMGLWRRVDADERSSDPFERALTKWTRVGSSPEELRSLEACSASIDELRALCTRNVPLSQRVADPEILPPPLALWGALQLAEEAGDDDRQAVLNQLFDETAADFQPRLLHELARAEDSRTLLSIGRRILTVDAANVEIAGKLARLELEDGNAKAAARVLAMVPADRRRSVELQILDAQIRFERGERRAATRTLQTLVRSAPDHLEAKLALAEALSRRKSHAEAARVLREATSQDPANASIRELLARELMDTRAYEEAVTEWRRQVQLTGETASNRFNLGLCLQRLGRLDAAVEQYDRCLILEPTKIPAIYNRGLALEKLGRTAEAREAYRSVLDLRSDHAGSRTKLAQLQEE